MSTQILHPNYTERNTQIKKAKRVHLPEIPEHITELENRYGQLAYIWDRDERIPCWKRVRSDGSIGGYVPSGEVMKAFYFGYVLAVDNECTCRPDGSTTCPACRKLAEKIYGVNCND